MARQTKHPRLSATEKEIADLRARSEEYHEKIELLLARYSELVEQNALLEAQNASLLNLCVATSRIHSSLKYGSVIRAVKEIIGQLIGGKSFRIYLVDKQRKGLVVLTSEGISESQNEAVGKGAKKAIKTGKVHVAEEQQGERREFPVASIPLLVSGQVMGAIVIGELLSQKKGLVTEDLQIFEVLGSDAANALYSAKLHWALEEEKKKGVVDEGVIDLLPPKVALERGREARGKK